jgi:hypothetical protein
VRLGDLDVHNIFDINWAFQTCCSRRHFEVAQWLASLGGVDVHANINSDFWLACVFGKLQAAQWLWSLGGVDIHADKDKVFRDTCENRHREVARWLVCVGGFETIGTRAREMLQVWTSTRHVWVSGIS